MMMYSPEQFEAKQREIAQRRGQAAPDAGPPPDSSFIMGLARALSEQQQQPQASALDQAVQSAESRLAQAQAQLAEAEARRAATPYLGLSNQPALAKWHQAKDAVAQAKQGVLEAQQALYEAVNKAAGKRYADKLQADHDALQKERDLAQAQQDMVAEVEMYDELERAWLAAGNPAVDFPEAYRTRLRRKEMDRRMEEAQAVQKRALLNSGRYSF